MKLRLTKEKKRLFKNNSRQYAVNIDRQTYFCTYCEKERKKQIDYGTRSNIKCRCGAFLHKVSKNALMKKFYVSAIIEKCGQGGDFDLKVWGSTLTFNQDMTTKFSEPKLVACRLKNGDVYASDTNYIAYGEFRYTMTGDSKQCTNRSRYYIIRALNYAEVDFFSKEVLNKDFKYIKEWVKNNSKYSANDILFKDPAVIEKLLKNCDKQYLEYYIHDDFNILKFNKAEIRFIHEHKLNLKQLRYFEKFRYLKIEKLEKYIEKQEYLNSTQGKIDAMNSSFRNIEGCEDGLYFVLPKARNDFEEEGKALKHCVAGYATSVDQNTAIVFVREEEDKALYTAELRYIKDSMKIQQFRGFKNEDAPKEIKLKLIQRIESQLKVKVGVENG